MELLIEQEDKCMKKIVFLILTVIFVSCQSIKKDAHIAIYKWEGFGELPSEYIILRPDDQIYDIYYGARGQYGQVGKYTIKNDTLYFTQSYSRLSDKVYFSDSDSIYIQKFLIEKNSLIDITDYSVLLPELFNNQSNKVIYKRCK